MKILTYILAILAAAFYATLFQTTAALAASTTVDMVPNNSLETVSPSDSTLPDQWNIATWGTSTPIYEYATDGHDSSRSVKLTMTNYVSGDARWDYAPQSLVRGTDYRFTAWYKTNTIPHVVAHYIKDDGSEDFFGLPDPEPTGTGWQQYSDVFPVPADVQAVSLNFYLNNDGWVQTDDYHITPYQYIGFDRGIVSLVFDDGFEQNITTALPVLNRYGFKTAQCVATQYVEGIPAQEANMKLFSNGGHEICSHSVTHPFLTQTSSAQIDFELSHSQTFLRNLTGQPITDFASPDGDYNAAVIAAMRTYYRSHRTTNEGFNSKDNLDPYRLRTQHMQASTTLDQFQSWINKAIADRTWLILTYHVVGTQNLEQFDTLLADFDAQMQWLASSSVAVARWDRALDEVTPPTTTPPVAPPTTTPSTTTQYTMALSPGWNLITLPLQPMNATSQPFAYSAETFGTLVGADAVTAWSTTTQSYSTHILGLPLNDFVLAPGTGFFIHLTTTSSFTLTGAAFTPNTTTSVTGWNLLGWTNPSSTVAAVYSSLFPTADTISHFDAIAQSWKTYLVNFPLNNFLINQGDGIFVHLRPN